MNKFRCSINKVLIQVSGWSSSSHPIPPRYLSQVDIDPKVEGRLADENGNITREDFIKFAQVMTCLKR